MVDNNPARRCAICNDSKVDYHYGVDTCTGCYDFFKRAARCQDRFDCSGGNKRCIINSKSTRKKCRYCRLKACLLAGMTSPSIREPGMARRLDHRVAVPRLSIARIQRILDHGDWFSREFGRNVENMIRSPTHTLALAQQGNGSALSHPQFYNQHVNPYLQQPWPPTTNVSHALYNNYRNVNPNLQPRYPSTYNASPYLNNSFLNLNQNVRQPYRFGLNALPTQGFNIYPSVNPHLHQPDPWAYNVLAPRPPLPQPPNHYNIRGRTPTFRVYRPNYAPTPYPIARTARQRTHVTPRQVRKRVRGGQANTAPNVPPTISPTTHQVGAVSHTENITRQQQPPRDEIGQSRSGTTRNIECDNPSTSSHTPPIGGGGENVLNVDDNVGHQVKLGSSEAAVVNNQHGGDGSDIEVVD